jgi:hypothetical protein
MASLDGATSRGASVDITTAAAYIPELWSTEIIKARDKALVLANKVMMVKPEGLAFGGVVNIPNLGNETALDKTAGSAVTYASATDTSVNININKHKYVAKLIEDIVKVQSKYDLFANFKDKIAKALANVVESDILALTASCAYSVGTASSVAASGVITTAGIVTAIRYLDDANVPQEDRYMVVDAYGREDLLNISDYIRYDAGGKTPAPINSGVIGELYGLQVLFSNNVANASSVAYGMVFHKDAFAVALQKDIGLHDEYSVDYIGTKLVGNEIYGVTCARTDHAVLLRYARA